MEGWSSKIVTDQRQAGLLLLTQYSSTPSLQHSDYPIWYLISEDTQDIDSLIKAALTYVNQRLYEISYLYCFDKLRKNKV